MDIFTSIQWDNIFGYFLHDCSFLILGAAGLLTTLTTACCLWMNGGEE